MVGRSNRSRLLGATSQPTPMAPITSGKQAATTCWRYHNRLDGNLQLPSESLWVAVANTDAYCNGNAYCNADAYCYCSAEVYADTAAASHAAASALRPAFNGRFSTGTRE